MAVFKAEHKSHLELAHDTPYPVLREGYGVSIICTWNNSKHTLLYPVLIMITITITNRSPSSRKELWIIKFQWMLFWHIDWPFRYVNIPLLKGCLKNRFYTYDQSHLLLELATYVSVNVWQTLFSVQDWSVLCMLMPRFLVSVVVFVLVVTFYRWFREAYSYDHVLMVNHFKLFFSHVVDSQQTSTNLLCQQILLRYLS